MEKTINLNITLSTISFPDSDMTFDFKLPLKHKKKIAESTVDTYTFNVTIVDSHFDLQDIKPKAGLTISAETLKLKLATSEISILTFDIIGVHAS